MGRERRIRDRHGEEKPIGMAFPVYPPSGIHPDTEMLLGHITTDPQDLQACPKLPSSALTVLDLGAFPVDPKDLGAFPGSWQEL